MTIEIIEAQKIVDEETDIWAVWLEITQLSTSWLLPTTAPGTLLESELQAHFDVRETSLFAVAQQRQIAPDAIYERVLSGRVLKAFAALVLDEINILRAEAGLSARTAEQLRTAIKTKLRG